MLKKEYGFSSLRVRTRSDDNNDWFSGLLVYPDAIKNNGMNLNG